MWLSFFKYVIIRLYCFLFKDKKLDFSANELKLFNLGGQSHM